MFCEWACKTGILLVILQYNRILKYLSKGSTKKNVFQTNQRYEEDDLKRAEDASRDTRFSAILAIGFGIAIALFFIFIVLIVPLFA